jgi:hypothetical protein
MLVFSLYVNMFQTEAEDLDGGSLLRQHSSGTLLPVSSEYVPITVYVLENINFN